MKALAITSKGIEDISADEIKELINAKTEIKDSCIIFEPKKLEDLALLCYKAQSVDKILFLFNHFNFNEKDLLDKLEKEIKKLDLSEWLDKNATFKVACRKVNESLTSEELCAKTGEMIINKIKKEKNYNQEVDLNSPDVIFFIYIHKDECYFGIDFSRIELNKRTYRIFTHQSSLRGTIAYSLLRIADCKEDQTIVDPFTGSGTIPIETALYLSKFPINYYSKDKFAFLKFKKINSEKVFQEADKKRKTDKLNLYGYDSFLGYITNAKKNAKIAGTHKLINFARIDVEWLDTKFEKETIDRIIAQPPKITNLNKKDIEKVYNELFYQAEFTLKKDGKIVLISETIDSLKKYAEKHKFRIKEQRQVYSGKAPMIVVTFER
ncbi:MAG: THUMP domain-containing protein [Candidatus Woesearchaeota archaeon]|jgi:putative N6-adenine-specific DNA methylase|nr:THUMP domain-containing protein [Candidatus Woesearchaeota archaeon]